MDRPSDLSGPPRRATSPAQQRKSLVDLHRRQFAQIRRTRRSREQRTPRRPPPPRQSHVPSLHSSGSLRLEPSVVRAISDQAPAFPPRAAPQVITRPDGATLTPALKLSPRTIFPVHKKYF